MALTMAIRLKRGAFAILATVCSSWVFLNRSTSGRSQWNPLGDRTRKFVEDANVSYPTLALWLYRINKTDVWLQI